MGAERVDERGWERIHPALNAGDPDDQLAACWSAKELVRSIYLTDDVDEAAEHLEAAIAWCLDAVSGPELTTLSKSLRRWRTEILNHHRTGASNGPVEAANLLIKQVKRSGRGFRNVVKLPATHPARGRTTQARDSPSHATPTSSTQVDRVGPLKYVNQVAYTVGWAVG